MNVIWKAACAATLIAATLIEIGCGNTFRPVAAPLPVTPGNPSGTETDVVLNQCPGNPNGCYIAATGIPSASVPSAIDVSGDSDMGDKQLGNTFPVGCVAGSAGCVVSPAGCTPGMAGCVVSPVPGPMALGFSHTMPMAFDYTRTTVLAANTLDDSVSLFPLSIVASSSSGSVSTIFLEKGSAPIGISFQYFGSTYTQDYVVNSGTGTTSCPGTGSLGVIDQTTPAAPRLKTTVCVGKTPDFAWIFEDQSKVQSRVFVLDYSENQVYVVDARTDLVIGTIPVGAGPVKVAQSDDGQYLYVLNSGDGSISIIDGLNVRLVATIPTSNLLTSALPIDIAMDANLNSSTTNALINSQVNHVWILHADGVVSVWDGTTPGALSWITSIATITPQQAAAGAYPTNLALLGDGTWAYVGVGNTDHVVGIDTTKLANRGVVTLGVNPCTTCSIISATTAVTVGDRRQPIFTTLTNNIPPGPAVSGNVLVETTTTTVNSIAVSRQGISATSTGGSSDLSKLYATTTTNTTYYCYDENVTPTDCANSDPWVNGTPITFLPSATPFLVAGCTDNGFNASTGLYSMSCPNLYNGTAVVAAAEIGAVTEGNTVIDPAIPVNTYIKTIPAPSVVIGCSPGNPATGEYDGQKNCPAMAPVMVLGRS
jgi:YVTN family beta-propeller protein